jgi:hypothetical protein
MGLLRMPNDRLELVGQGASIACVQMGSGGEEDAQVACT